MKPSVNQTSTSNLQFMIFILMFQSISKFPLYNLFNLKINLKFTQGDTKCNLSNILIGMKLDTKFNHLRGHDVIDYDFNWQHNTFAVI